MIYDVLKFIFKVRVRIITNL